MLRPLVGTPAATPTAVAIDLENILHPLRRLGGHAAGEGLRAVLTDVASICSISWVIGVGDYWLCRLLIADAHQLGVRLFPGPIGPDRADGELIRRLATDVPSSLEHVVLVSGDGGFAGTVVGMRATGRSVTVAGRPASISATLRLAADRTLELRSLASLSSGEVA